MKEAEMAGGQEGEGAVVLAVGNDRCVLLVVSRKAHPTDRERERDF